MAAVLQQMPAGLVIADLPDGMASLVNEQARVITGYDFGVQVPIEQYVALQTFEGLHPDGSVMQMHEWPLWRAIHRGEVITGEEIELLRADGTRVSIEANAAPIHDTSGQIIAGVTIFTDVTEKVRARQALADQRALLNTIIEGAPVALVFFDRDLRVVDFNTKWAETMGFDPSVARGHSIYELSDTAVHRAALHRRVLAGEAAYFANYELVHAQDGTTHYYDLFYTPNTDAGGKVTGLVVSMIDVTERHELDRRKDEFMALASHELKTPITTIKGYTQMLVNRSARAGQLPGGDARTARALQVVDEQASRLVRLIDELLDVSRIQGASLEMHCEWFDLRGLLSQAVSATQLTASGFHFSLNLPPAPLTVYADVLRLEQVIANLLQNAVKYSGGRKKIEVGSLHRGGEVIVWVRDRGVGIPPDQQKQVFERFYRASNARHRAGLGLGLFISHGIVERHGGRMWCESRVGEGSTFYFALPRAEQERTSTAEQE